MLLMPLWMQLLTGTSMRRNRPAKGTAGCAKGRAKAAGYQDRVKTGEMQTQKAWAADDPEATKTWLLQAQQQQNAAKKLDQVTQQGLYCRCAGICDEAGKMMYPSQPHEGSATIAHRVVLRPALVQNFACTLAASCCKRAGELLHSCCGVLHNEPGGIAAHLCARVCERP